ncbi:hypothetical protein [Rhizobium leguminosarum]
MSTTISKKMIAAAASAMNGILGLSREEAAYFVLSAALRAEPCEPVDEITALSKRCAELEAALKLSFRAINDWVVVYASDMCDDARVEETKLRIRDAGGTLAYVAEINSVLGPLLQEQKGVERFSQGTQDRFKAMQDWTASLGGDEDGK